MFKLDVKEIVLAQSYAAYMMAASCFRASVCTTPQMEKRAYLIYRLAGERKQLELEERILSLLDKKIIRHLGKEFLSSKVEVRFLYWRKSRQYRLREKAFRQVNRLSRRSISPQRSYHHRGHINSEVIINWGRH